MSGLFAINVIAAALLLLAPCVYADQPGLRSDEPVEITADHLMVDNGANTAIFTGNVVATQKTVTLKSDKMTAYYSNKGASGQEGSISKIVTIGHVVITNPAQTASGDEGEYLVQDEIMELNGSVVLIKGDNVIKGNKLVYNLKTGKSKLWSNNTSSDEDSSRVKAILRPQKKSKE